MQMFQFIAMVMGVLFPAWPVLVAAPLSWRRRADTLGQMFAMWVFFLIGWIMARFVPPLPSYLIPEPLNTYTFFFAGAVLFLIIRIMKNR